MKLKDYCAKENITLKYIADSLNISYNYFAHCASGIKRFSYNRAKMVSEFCNGEVSVDDLIPYEKINVCPSCQRPIQKSSRKTSGH